MIISLSIFSSIFTYLEASKNKVKIITQKGINLTFIFIVFLFTVWEVINLTTFDLNISYSLLFCLYAIVFAIIIISFASINVWFWIKQKQHFKVLIEKIPLLIALLFLSIFFLFFCQKISSSPNEIGIYYALMNQLHKNGNNLITHELISHFAQYLPVGFYQFGSSLDLATSFYLIPFLTAYIFFYFCTVIAYSIIEKFFFNSQWKINLLFVVIFAVIIFFYLFYNFDSQGSAISGEWVAASYSLLLLLPFLMNIKKISNHYQILFVFLFLLFINETSASLAVFMIPILLVIIIFYRKKHHFSFLFFWFAFLSFILSLYIAVIITFSFKDLTNLISTESHLLFALPFITYLLIFIGAISWLLIFLINHHKINLKIPLWDTNFLSINKNYWWFKRNHLYLSLLLVGISEGILIVSLFNIFSKSHFTLFNLICSIVFAVTLLAAFFLIIKNKKINLYFVFVISYCCLIFIIHLIGFKFNFFPIYFWTKLSYSTLYIGINYVLTIRIFIYSLFFIFSAVDLKKSYLIPNWISKLLKFKVNPSSIFVQSTCLFLAFATIPVPTYQAISNPNSIPTFRIPPKILQFELNNQTLQNFNSLDFCNELSFDDSYLNSLNETTMTWLPDYYLPTMQMQQFYSSILDEKSNDLVEIQIMLN